MKKIFFLLCFFNSIIYGHIESLQWSPEKIERAQLEILKAGPGMIYNIVEVPAEIHFDPDYVTYILPKINGVATAIFKSLGDRVDKGEVLAILESREMAESKAHYLAALKKWELKKTLLKKEEGLKNISAEIDYLHAKHEAEDSEIELDLTKQHLFSLGLTSEEIQRIEKQALENLRFYHIKSPIGGRVTYRNLTMGEFVSDMTKIFTVANFDEVWVEMSLNEAEASNIKINDPVEIVSTNGNHEQAILSQFNPTIHEDTRRATAIAVLNNQSGKWKIGEYVTAKVIKERTHANIVVPPCALQNLDGNTIVFVEKENTFFPRVVNVGKMDESNVEIISGLEAGESFVGNNCFLIKADMEKEEGENHH